jgi:predicted GH43/DUF377 family glycosyl hydrolase
MELIRKHGGLELENVVYRSGPPVKFSFQSPYVIHNENLARQWLSNNGITAMFPPVTRQVEAMQINPRALFQNGYNPSIVRHEGKLLMAYRFHPMNAASTRLAMAELDEDGNVTANTEITGIEGNSIEDPKLWSEDTSLWMSWVRSNWPQSATCLVACGQISKEGGKWKLLGDEIVKPYGKNDGTAMEKNWVFFNHAGRRLVIYSSHPEKIVYDTSNDLSFDAQKIRWKWGEIKGGTSPVPYKNALLRFFHSTLDNEPVPFRRRYYVGAMLMEPFVPFTPIAISRQPIISGSEDDSLTELSRASCGHYKPKVVFPGGCVSVDDGWLLSLGVNDSSCVIAKIKPVSLNL